jgi:hypothetical protein
MTTVPIAVKKRTVVAESSVERMRLIWTMESAPQNALASRITGPSQDV